MCFIQASSKCSCFPLIWTHECLAVNRKKKQKEKELSTLTFTWLLLPPLTFHRCWVTLSIAYPSCQSSERVLQAALKKPQRQKLLLDLSSGSCFVFPSVSWKKKKKKKASPLVEVAATNRITDLCPVFPLDWFTDWSDSKRQYAVEWLRNLSQWKELSFPGQINMKAWRKTLVKMELRCLNLST